MMKIWEATMKAILPCCVACLAIVILPGLLAATASTAEPPDAAEMRRVALAFSKAVRAGDLTAAKAMAVGSAKNMETLDLVSKTWKTLDAFFEAIQKADPLVANELKDSKRVLGLTEDLDKQAANAVITVDRDLATLSKPPTTRPASPPPSRIERQRDIMADYDDEPFILRKVGGKWKVDLDATFHAKSLDTEKGIAYWREANDTGEKMIAAIKSPTAHNDAVLKLTAEHVQLEVKDLATALRIFEVDVGRFPTAEEGLDPLIHRPAAEPTWKGPYIKGGLPVDPWKHPYQYRNPGTHNPATVDVFSMGPDGKAGTADDIGNWTDEKK
jgi:general secretion pathway protein G